MKIRHPPTAEPPPSTSCGRSCGQPSRETSGSLHSAPTEALVSCHALHKIHKMIDWQQSQVTEQPILMDHSNDDILKFQESPLVLDIPSSTQFVESMIQTITRIGKHAASHEVCDGITRATFSNRSSCNKMETKADFDKP
jgi:hypothetical protein